MKYLTYFVIVILLISSFTAIGLGKDTNEKNMIKMNFSNINTDITIVNNQNFVEISIDGSNAVLYKSDQPMLPIYTKTFILPFGTKISDIDYEIGEIKSSILSYKILPAPKPMTIGEKRIK